MGKRGPKPTPTDVLKLRGSWRGNARGESLEATGTVGDCPPWLGETGKAKWNELREILEPLGHASALDRDSFIFYVDSWQDYLSAVESIEKHGSELPGPRGRLVANPALKRRQQAFARMNRFANDYGLTPAARRGLVAKQRKENDKACFFRGGET